VGAHRYTLLDVFTATPLEGNALAVVHDADQLDDATMLAVARETRLSETTFVQRAHVAGADYRNRIFTVERELPFAGHPSLGTAVAMARAEQARATAPANTGPREVRYVQQTGAGLQPIDVRLDGPHRAHASMLQEPAAHGDEVPRSQVMDAIGLTPEHADRALPPQLVGTGLTQLIVPLRDLDALARARPDWPAVERLLTALKATVLYAAVCDSAQQTARTRAFVSAAVGEDPATGSAAGPLCAYLAARTGTTAVTIEQGIEMGRPSRLEAAMEGERPRVGGDVVVVGDGTLHL
jgi:trans-2,3-dihydro-3-hydroxyanthranilate isomerase